MIRSRTRTRTSDIGDQLGSLVRGLDLATDRLPEESVATGRYVADKVERRLGHGTTHTLVAFLGATGGGKSSLTNAIVGSDVATTGIRRPTTSSTLACSWGPDDPTALLDWLEIPNRHQVGSRVEPDARSDLDGLVLLDVPDHDSIEAANRAEMERIAEHADLLVWVTDPEKYGDKAMHTYLQSLDEHGAVMAMVLNKADQLTAAELDECRLDLARLLAADGIQGPPVVATSTTTGDGIDELRAVLTRTVEDREAMVARLRADIRATASDLLTDLGPDDGVTSVPSEARTELSTAFVDAAGLDALCDAVAAGHRRDAVVRTGWPFTRWLRSLRPHPLRRLHLGKGSGGRATLPAPSGVQRTRTEAAVQATVHRVTSAMPDPWPALVRRAATPDNDVLTDRIEVAATGAVRGIDSGRPWWWSMANAVQLALAAAVVVGLGWLSLLALGAYLRLPEVPTPSWRGIPIPTGLLIGGVVLGLLLAFIARRMAAVGAARRARWVRRRAREAIDDVADELVLGPMQAELDRRGELRRSLEEAMR